jgi:hypothetical protein
MAIDAGFDNAFALRLRLRADPRFFHPASPIHIRDFARNKIGVSVLPVCVGPQISVIALFRSLVAVLHHDSLVKGSIGGALDLVQEKFSFHCLYPPLVFRRK